MLLSELNPLQYIPVIGTLYRAVTGDVIPTTVRDAGSMLFSALIAGPIGVATDAAELAAEKVTGIDPEKIGDKMLAKLGLDHQLAATRVAEKPADSAKPPEQIAAWSNAQLAAYGVTHSTNGELQRGPLIGSDALNSLELDTIQAQQAMTRYAAAT